MSGDKDKLRQFLHKEPGKLDMVIGIIFGICLFFAYRVGLRIGEKWPYVLLLVLSIFLSVLVYMLLSELLSMKFVVVVNILYSVFMLVQDKLKIDWLYNLEEEDQKVLGVLLFVIVSLGNLMAAASGIFVLVFGYLLGGFWRSVLCVIIYGVPRIPKFLCSCFWSRVRGPMPDVQSIVKGDKRVYLYKDCHKEQIQLIYRQGSKRRILDTYQWDNLRETQYSLEWDGRKQVIVRKYNTTTSRQVEQKEYKIKNVI